MNNKWLFLFITINISTAFGGSILSSRGIGLPYDNPNIRSMGMGSVCIANPSASRIDDSNPAGLSEVKTTQLAIQSVMHTNKYKDPFYNSRSAYANFDGFHFAVPLGQGLCFGLGAKPVTRIDYKISFTDSLGNTPCTKSLEGSGGLNRIALITAWSPVKFFSLGVRVSYLMGRLIEESRIRFQSSAYISGHDRIATHAEGINWTLGCTVHPNRSWTLGGLYSPKAVLDTQADLYQIFQTASLDPGTLQYPATWGVGASVNLKEWFVIAADYQSLQWKQLQINGQSIQDIRNTSRVSVGIEKLPSADLYAAYYKRIPLRAGVIFQPYYILDPEGNSISELWWTFGFGLPLFQNASHIDFMIGIGKRGALDQNGLEENLIRFGLSVSGGEKWFVRSR